MTDRNLLIVKLVSLALVAVALVIAGIQFYDHRNFQEEVVKGPGVTQVRKLSDYFEPLKGTINDCNIYIFDSGVPGGTAFLIGSSHPEEPSGNLTAQLFVENAKLTKGRLIVAIRANQSASRVTRPGDAYPLYFTIETPWGEKKFRMGDRWSSPLDSWPDPEVYVNYPSGQLLAYMDVRNFNRTWPGRANGIITEQTNYAFMNLIKEEGVDIFIDLHEAELDNRNQHHRRSPEGCRHSRDGFHVAHLDRVQDRNGVLSEDPPRTLSQRGRRPLGCRLDLA
jgi:hypothetical protein